MHRIWHKIRDWLDRVGGKAQTRLLCMKWSKVKMFMVWLTLKVTDCWELKNHQWETVFVLPPSQWTRHNSWQHRTFARVFSNRYANRCPILLVVTIRSPSTGSVEDISLLVPTRLVVHCVLIRLHKPPTFSVCSTLTVVLLGASIVPGIFFF